MNLVDLKNYKFAIESLIIQNGTQIQKHRNQSGGQWCKSYQKVVECRTSTLNNTFIEPLQYQIHSQRYLLKYQPRNTINFSITLNYQTNSLPLLQKSTENTLLHSPKLFFFMMTVVLIISAGLFLFFELTNTNDQIYDLVRFSSPSALCLDGSNAGYYISRTGDPSKVFLYFQFGGWCGDLSYEKTLESCYERSNGIFGSMKYDQNQIKYDRGVMSNHKQNYFRDWKRVLLRYCDGSGHQGTRKEPILYNGKQLYFRGHNITVQQLESLEEKIGLFSKSSQIVVSGQSAGGLASLMWTNYIAQRTKNAVVTSIPGSGIFIDTYHHKYNAFFLRQAYKNVINITNKEIDPPVPKCLQDNPDEKQKCFFAQYLYKYIKVPMFVIQSLYDSWSIVNVLGIECKDMAKHSFLYCNTSQMHVIDEHYDNLMKVLVEISKKQQNGVWGIACPVHAIYMEERFYNNVYRVPEFSSNSVSEAIKNWMDNTLLIDIYMDNVKWPNNHPCQAYG